MSYSSGFIVNVNKLNVDDPVLVLMEINHSFISGTIRLVNDNEDLISNGHNYVSMPFEAKRQSDVIGELPKIQIVIQNIGRNIVKWVDSSGGGKGAEIILKLVRRSAPDSIEESLKLGVDSANVTTENVSFNLIIQNNLSKRSCRLLYDVKRSYGLY